MLFYLQHSLASPASPAFSASTLRRTARQHYTTETQFIDIDEERLMHGVVLAHRILHSHGAFHETGSGSLCYSLYTLSRT